MNMGKRAPSLQDIADATGFSLMTVSRAIRGTGLVKAATAERIYAEADRIGYKYNPEISRMMSLMRSGHRDRYHENIALLWFSSPDNVARNPFLKRIHEGAAARAAQLGYKLESFNFAEYELKARRVAQAVESRGIRGIILLPLLEKKELVLAKLKMDWERFAWTAFGNTHTNEEFHRVGHHHFFGIEHAMKRLKQQGYRRPFLAVSAQLDATVHHAYSAGFLMNHPLGPQEAHRFIGQNGQTNEALVQAIDACGADAVITHNAAHLISVLSKAGRSVPGDIGCLCLHCKPDDSAAGIDQRNDILGQYAVDMIVAQLHRKEAGLPDNPKLMLHKGSWHPGTTLPVRSNRPCV